MSWIELHILAQNSKHYAFKLFKAINICLLFCLLLLKIYLDFEIDLRVGGILLVTRDFTLETFRTVRTFLGIHL